MSHLCVCVCKPTAIFICEKMRKSNSLTEDNITELKMTDVPTESLLHVNICVRFAKVTLANISHQELLVISGQVQLEQLNT